MEQQRGPENSSSEQCTCMGRETQGCGFCDSSGTSIQAWGCTPVALALGKGAGLRQEDLGFQASLGYTVRPFSKTKQIQGNSSKYSKGL